ncbi:GntR family transcriptional regulator [Paenibacillus sp. MB22_1]|uniref:GntR family transcriptional regulator n=1 Tax=unclassified Paenibacillus TaxID=185978 RepID=UPI0001AFCF43|nr:GntR family transcriptional regulator [Paenibacillus sp. oral taxon 786]EES73824.1 UbiC transcription regulator-associated domain protein [Paenibacillus sp. oral taxon 786 str. D14]
MMLSRKDRPLYLQIKNILKERILHGVYPLGSNIPSEPQLEQEFAVSKITVRGAIQELVQEGYLEKGSGKGTKVIRNKAASKWSKWKHFTEILVEESHQIRKEWLRAETVRNEAGSELHQLFGERCLKLERAYYLDGEPYIFYEHYLAAPWKEPSEPELEDFRDHSLYEVLEEWGVSLDKLRDEFAVSLPPAEAKQFLRLADGVPVLKRSRYSRDVQGRLAEYSIGYYNTELQSYIVDYDA